MTASTSTISKLYTPHLGEITTLHIVIMGMMAQVQLEETGIHNNVSYASILEWGRCEFVKDPGTGKPIARINLSKDVGLLKSPSCASSTTFCGTASRCDKKRLPPRSALGTEAPEMLLPANLPELYRRKIAELEPVLGDEGMAAVEMIRSMVDRVVLSPCPSGTELEARLHGDLLAILEACAEADPKRRQPASLEAGCQLSVVAGAGFEPAAFRL